MKCCAQRQIKFKINRNLKKDIDFSQVILLSLRFKFHRDRCLSRSSLSSSFGFAQLTNPIAFDSFFLSLVHFLARDYALSLSALLILRFFERYQLFPFVAEFLFTDREHNFGPSSRIRISEWNYHFSVVEVTR